MAEIILRAATGEVRAVTRVDDEGFAELSRYRWHLTNAGYVARSIWRGGRRVVLMHRQILGLGRRRANLVVDHINRDPLDNRRSNLRLVTHAENLRNCKPLGGSSGHPGVHFFKRTGRWMAYGPKEDGKRRYLGYFDTEEEAAAVAAGARATRELRSHAS